MQKSRISVVIPTYNCKNLLALTLDSLCRQTLDKSLFEVIIVDDGSTDGTEKLVKKYVDQVSIKYFSQEDAGFRAAKARNIGIKNSKNEIILFFDSGMVASTRMLDLHRKMHSNRSNLAVMVSVRSIPNVKMR
jgi:glycosyltransferase involved in cell wall biosynthesis